VVPAIGKAGRTLEPQSSKSVMDNTARVQAKERGRQRERVRQRQSESYQ
jgi:hypothetical protein